MITPCGFNTLFRPRKVVQLWHMRQHIVADHQISLRAVRHELLCQVFSKEPDERLDAALLRRRRNVFCRFNAEHRDTLSHEVLQQIAIIAGNLDDLTGSGEVETFYRHLHIRPWRVAAMSRNTTRNRRNPRKSTLEP